MPRTLALRTHKTKNNIRCIAQAACAVSLLFITPALAQTSQTKIIAGVAYVEDCGMMTVNGQRLTLWGVDTLAPDQKCWQGDAAWSCGEEAIVALKHFAGGRSIECEIKTAPDDTGPALARCFRIKQKTKIDIAELLIKEGWALERGESSGGIYFEAEQDAQNNKRGVWSGRFQTARDWKDGIQRFVGEETEEPLAEPAE